jgi:gluconate kinase
VTTPPPAGWVPIRLYWRDGQALVDWCYLGDHTFTDPFFEQTIEVCLRSPFNLVFRQQTSVETLLEAQSCRPGPPPTGFIFHLSRCGSTLVAQMLAALPRHVVLSEAGPIDAVLNAHKRDPRLDDTQRIAWLRAMVSALGQRRRGETHLFIKFDCWHTLDLPLIRRAFPDVPWIFVYRDPVEILVSQVRQRGAHLTPRMLGPGLPGVDLAMAVAMGPEEYCARFLALICQAALDQHRAAAGLLINYRQLPDAVCSSILSWFGVSCPSADLERMREAARFNAKTPSMYFSDDSAEKNRAATDLIRRMADTWVAPLYQQLEAARIKVSGEW